MTSWLKIFPRLIRSGVAEPLTEKLSVALERSVNDAIEMLRGQSEVGTYLFFILFGNEIPGEHFPVPRNFYFAEGLAHQRGAFALQERVIGTRLQIRDRFGVNCSFLNKRPSRLALIVKRQVARHPADKAREPGGLSHLAQP